MGAVTKLEAEIDQLRTELVAKLDALKVARRADAAEAARARRAAAKEIAQARAAEEIARAQEAHRDSAAHREWRALAAEDLESDRVREERAAAVRVREEAIVSAAKQRAYRAARAAELLKRPVAPPAPEPQLDARSERLLGEFVRDCAR